MRRRVKIEAKQRGDKSTPGVQNGEEMRRERGFLIDEHVSDGRPPVEEPAYGRGASGRRGDEER